MRHASRLVGAAALLAGLTGFAAAAAAADPALEGAWIARAMETDGAPARPEVYERIRFTFKGDKLLVRGNFPDDREETCPFTVDATKSPKQLQFTPPGTPRPILAIYEVQDGLLLVCLRHGGSDKGRPAEFATEKDSSLVLIEFEKAAP